ncbi:recombinase family protein, partial [Chitinophaga sp.]|uniref:recombinase family protein n=1 Tax=Chitinophaga sp. TaxID=1869181 RepID=UPI002F9275CE
LYLRDVPLNVIKERARELGYLRKGNMAVERILANPIYIGLQYAKPFKEHPGGLFPTFNEKIIKADIWYAVQSKMRKPVKNRTSIDSNLPLRGLLKCHCGQPLSGAPSKGKTAWFYYYKCKFSKHNNISAIKSENQLLEAWELMSLPKSKVIAIKSGSEKVIQEEAKKNAAKSVVLKQELDQCQLDLFNLEEKWIKNQVTHDTYERFYSFYKEKIAVMESKIEMYNRNTDTVYTILNKNIDMFSDMKFVYEKMEVLEKRELIKLVFDSNLYYQNGVYRTPTMMEIFTHNCLIMKEKNVLIYEKKRDNFSVIPHSGERGIRTLGTV